MSSFCCGCPLAFGTGLVVLVNLVQNLFYLTTATMSIILRIPGVSSGSMVTQTLNAAWCMLGLPFIAAGLWGVLYKQESNVRLFLWYLTMSFGLDVIFLVSYFTTTDLCGSAVPEAVKQHGSAFACGFMRLWSLVFVLAMLIVVAYFLFTVWSFCEDLKAGGGGAGFPALLASAQEAGELRIKRREAPMYGAFVNTFGGGGDPSMMGGPQGNFSFYKAPGLGDNRRIFNGVYHETAYPPPKY